MPLTTFPADRIAALLLLPIFPLMLVGGRFDPGLETRPEYFAESFARFVPQRDRFLVGVLLLAPAVSN